MDHIPSGLGIAPTNNPGALDPQLASCEAWPASDRVLSQLTPPEFHGPPDSIAFRETAPSASMLDYEERTSMFDEDAGHSLQTTMSGHFKYMGKSFILK